MTDYIPYAALYFGLLFLKQRAIDQRYERMLRPEGGAGGSYLLV